jgi:hypothetical protein
MADRDAGTMGESEFGKWCASVGLVANKAGQDAGGWDYFVQFGSPVVPKGVLTLDHIEPPRLCCVQVKSTDNRSAPDIKLSNWLRMIDPTLPFFVLLLNFGGQDFPIEANLVHIEARQVARALKRLRELGTTDAEFLNKHTMVVPWDDADRLPTPNGKALLAGLENHLGASASDYLAAKKRWCEESGYDHERFKLTFTTTAPSVDAIEEQMIDFALGLTKELPCTVTSIEEIRFGIAAPADDGKIPRDASITLREPPSIPGTLELSDESGLRRVSHPVRFFHPRIVFPFLPKERLRFRMTMANVDIVLGGQDSRPKFHVAPLSTSDERRPLAEWARTIQAIKFLTEPGQTLTMALDVLGIQVKWKLSGLQCSPIPAFDVEVMQAVLDAASALDALKVEVDEPISLLELHHRRHRLAEAALVLRSRATDVVLNGDVAGDPPDGLVVGNPLVLAIPIGRILVVVGMAHFGPIVPGEQNGSRKKFRVVNPERKTVFVEKMPMVHGQTYPADPWVQKVAAWITEQKIELLPAPVLPDDD